jgi:hypothetical protein
MLPRARGPIAIPAMMYAKRLGCLSFFRSALAIAAAMTISAMWMNSVISYAKKTPCAAGNLCRNLWLK